LRPMVAPATPWFNGVVLKLPATGFSFVAGGSVPKPAVTRGVVRHGREALHTSSMRGDAANHWRANRCRPIPRRDLTLARESKI
jgi:hypothetical protein